MRLYVHPMMTSLALLAPLAACQQQQLDGTTAAIANNVQAQPQLLPGVPAGFECPLVPNGFDPAGSIYRLDKSGTYYRVKDYSSDPEIMAMKGYRRDVKVANYVFTDEQKSSAGVSFAVLKTAMPGLTAGANADFKKNLVIDIAVEDMMAESIDDEVADKILERLVKEGKPKSGSKYFLVREAVRAGTIGYSLKRDDVAKLGGQAQMEKLANANANVTFKDNNGVFEIKQKFSPERIAVCIKSAEIVVGPSHGHATPTLTLKDPGDTTMPPITKIGEGQSAALTPSAAKPAAATATASAAPVSAAAQPATVVPPVSTAQPVAPVAANP